MRLLLNRFLTYAKIYSTSDPESETTLLQKTMGYRKIHFFKNYKFRFSDVSMDENGYIMAYVPSNISENEPTVSFIAHYDTSPDFNGKCKIHKFGKITSGDLVLNKETGLRFLHQNSQSLKNIGKTLITTDGTSLLGADDKAGVAEIVTAANIFSRIQKLNTENCYWFYTRRRNRRGAHKFDVKIQCRICLYNGWK